MMVRTVVSGLVMAYSDGFRTQLPTVGEVQAVTLAFRRRFAPGAQTHDDRQPDAEPDEKLLELIADPFESVSDAHTRLTKAEAHLRVRSDRRSVFLTVYAEMTANVGAGIESGAFDDPDWVREYLVAFANRYRRALIDFERGNLTDVPPAWKLGFHASTNDDTLLIQDALLGINAHINYDLAFTLRDVSIDPDRPSKLRDHDRINRILRQLVDVIQRALAEVYNAEGYTHIDNALGSFDEEFMLVGLTEARSLAWRNAVLLNDAQPAFLRRLVKARVRIVSLGTGYFILAPSAIRPVLWVLRQVERDTPPIDSLQDGFRRRVEDEEIRIE